MRGVFWFWFWFWLLLAVEGYDILAVQLPYLFFGLLLQTTIPLLFLVCSVVAIMFADFTHGDGLFCISEVMGAKFCTGIFRDRL